MSEWQDWIGREEKRTDRVDEGLFTRWLATLDRAAPADGAVPQAFHWCLCTPDAPTAKLGPDGHPLRDDDSPAGFLPPVPLPRRMWASSKVEFLAPLRPGQSVSRTSRIASVAEKQGGSGRLVFVDVAHETHGDGVPCVREVQSIVYREAPPRRNARRAAASGRGALRPDGMGRAPGADAFGTAPVPLFRADLQQPPHPL